MSLISISSKSMSKERLKSLYEALLWPRLIEEKMLILLRQGKISKWFSGMGQEAISVGTALALDSDEYILPMHRNLGVFTTRDVSLSQLFKQFQGKPDGFTKSRDRSFHFGSKEHHIVGMISHLGPQMGVADGIALANKLSKTNKVTAVFTGDGGTSEGDFHESINLAAVWDLPVLFIVENNGYGLSTPSAEQFRCKQFIDKAIGYGIDTIQVDGNDLMEVYQAITHIAEQVRKKPRPVLVECITFRMRGHEEASGTKYVPQELMDAWAQKDPVDRMEKEVLEKKALTKQEIDALKANIKSSIDKAWQQADQSEDPVPSVAEEYNDVYASFDAPLTSISGGAEELRLIDAIAQALQQAMERHDGLVLMGQDIAEYGGVFKATEGLLSQFGADRVRNTPLCESAVVGAALGLSIAGYKAMMEMQFADFVSEAMTQIANNLAKIHWRWGQHADVVIRMPTGGGVAAGPFHSQSNEAWFTHVPGLKVVYPAFPADAKGLLLRAFEDPNPVMFFEHKALYRSQRQDVPEDYYTLPIGKASTVRKGSRASIITYGMGVHWALEVLDEQAIEDVEVVDLRTLLPLDTDAIYESVRRTGRAMVLHEDNLTGGWGAEIAALIGEHCFESLDGPVVRLGSLDTPVPFHSNLEQQFFPKERLKKELSDWLAA